MTYFGLYKITNLINGKMYIGQHTTSNLDDGYMGSGVALHNAFKKYGIENFRKEWIMFCEDSDELNYYERVFVDQNWMDRSDTYNLILGGDMYQLGKKLSKESRKKISEKTKKRLSDKTNHPMYGKHTIPWNKGKKGLQVAWNKDKKMSEESRLKLSESRKLYCKNNPNSTDRNSGKHWYNNGVKSVLAFEKPNGFIEGRL